jgi:hypothetical protein
VIKIFSRDTALQSTIAHRIAASVGAFGSSDQAAQGLDALMKNAGAGPGAGVNTGGSLTTTVDTKEVQIQIETLQRGGSNRTNVTTVAQLIDRYRTFPSTVRRAEDTVPMGFHLQAYTNAGNGDQVRGKLFAISDRTAWSPAVLWPTYMNYILAEEALTFWLQRWKPAELVRAVLLLRPAEGADAPHPDRRGPGGDRWPPTRCGRGLACTASRLERRSRRPGNAIVSQLPVRKQLYAVGAKAFMEAAGQRGPLRRRRHRRRPLNTRVWANASSTRSRAGTPGLPTAQHVRVWTARRDRTSCRFRIFDGGRLRAPWDIQSTDFDIDGVNQTLEKRPSGARRRSAAR